MDIDPTVGSSFVVLTDPALARLGNIVHEADVEDERYDAPEAAGLDSIIRGMGQLLGDAALLEATGPIYDGLLARLHDPEHLTSRASMSGR